MGIDFRGLAASVSQQCLNIAQIGALLQQMRGKGMSERVQRGFCLYPRLFLAGMKHAPQTV